MMSREKMIEECIRMTAELEGLKESQYDRTNFEAMDTEKLVQEYNWLWDMVNLK